MRRERAARVLRKAAARQESAEVRQLAAARIRLEIGDFRLDELELSKNGFGTCKTSSSEPWVSMTRAESGARSTRCEAIRSARVVLRSCSDCSYRTVGQMSVCSPRPRIDDDWPSLLATLNVYALSAASVTSASIARCRG